MSVDIEERLRVAAGDVVGQSTVGGVVVVEGLELYDAGAGWTGLGHARSVDGLGGLWSVVVDVVHVDEDIDE